MKKLELELKKNVRAGIQVRAKQSKEQLENYKEELETAKKEKGELEESLKKLTDEITKVTDDLKSMGIEGEDTVNSLCKNIFLFFHFCFKNKFQRRKPGFDGCERPSFLI